ncbi:MAG: S8 family serine peptidase [Elusimicrobiota bacterium]
MPSRLVIRFAALAAAMLLAWPRTADASKLNARLGVVRAQAARRISVAGVAAPPPVFRVLLRLTPGAGLQEMRAAYPGTVFGSQSGPIVTAAASDADLTAFESDPRVVSVEAARTFKPTLDVVRSNQTNGGNYLGTTINAASADLANVDGTGVIVGVVDTGIDYRHADFITGGVSRIKYIWDQTDAVGPAQSLVTCAADCGSEWTNAQITSSLATGSPVRERDTAGHGTHVTGIAAGNGNAGNGTLPAGTFKGLAPKADIIMVKTDFSDAGILDGMNYIVARAAALGQKAVINLSLGNQIDPHDGTSNFDVGVGNVAANTPVVVAMGNDGNSSPHAQAASMSFNQTITYAVSVVAGTSTDAEVDFWGSNTDSYSVTVTLGGLSCPGMTEASGSATGASPFSCGGNTVNINNAGSGSGSTSASDREMYVDVSNAANLSITSMIVSVTCTRAGGCGLLDGFLFPGSEGTSFGAGSGYSVPLTLTMAAPATANNVIAVASYASKVGWTDLAGNPIIYSNGQVAGQISDFSSTGPTRDGRQKPDVAAPGEGIGSSMSSNATFNAVQILQDNLHVIDQGTSMATPVVTGIIAARLQTVPTRTVAQLRAIIQGTARSDSAVTASGGVPNYVFGYGKVVSSPQPQAAPSGLTAVSLGISSIAWSWSSTTLGADAYDAYLATKTTQSLILAAQSPFNQTGLLANATYQIFLRGEGGGIEGPGAFSATTATYAAAPVNPPSATGFVSSVTVNYSMCTAIPDPLSCSGYVVEASTASDFSGTLFSSATTNTALTQLKITGLTASTNYVVRVGALNQAGGTTWGAVPGSFNTGTSLVAPSSPSFDQFTTSAIRFNWALGANPGGLSYIAQTSTAANFTGTLFSQTVAALNATFAGLTPDTSYFFRVQAVGGPYLTAGPAATLALAPAVSTTPFLSVTAGALTAAWSNPGNQPDTLYRADLAPIADFTTIAQTQYVRSGAAAFAGLTPNTAYYVRAQAVSRSGATTAFVATGSTGTMVYAPTLPGAPISAQATGGFSFTYLSGGNPGTVPYYVRVSTDPAFSVLAASASTTALTASFSGLLSNQLYYVSVAGVNLYGTQTAFVGASTATAVAAPVLASVAVTTRNATGFGFAWTPGTLAPGTAYSAQVSSSPSFSFLLTSSATANAFATFTGLLTNTTYYGRVQAVSLSANPDGPYLSAAAGATLPNAPSAAAQAFIGVSFTSITVAWTPLPASPPSATAEGYRLEVSTVSDFRFITASAEVSPAASSATVAGLLIATTYYARVGALSWEGLPNYYWVAGSTISGIPALSSGTQTGSGLTLTVVPTTSALTLIRVDVPAAAFPAGTLLSAVTSVGLSVVGARSNEAAGLTPFGPPTAFDLSAGGLQPSSPVRVTISYDPTQIPAGQDERHLHLWRFDTASGQWTLIPSQTDPATHALTAYVQHFSSFAPFFVTPGTDLSAVQVFPQPWELGDASSRYWANQLSFTGLPGGARVRLITLTGEQVFDGQASGGGVFTWDGSTRFGRRAASGTYYAVVDAGGARLVRRVVVIR